ncbi:MAG: hypothetical protein JSU87_04550, partial [Gemmatimonadota bacterium]
MMTYRCALIVMLCGTLCSLSAIAQEEAPTEDAFFELIRRQGVAEAVAAFESLRQKQPDAVVFSESSMNRLGYQYVNEGKVEDAIQLFKLNVMAYPDAFNTY